nr:pectinesterase-like [Tanacetum cinerariifolium]
MESVLDDFIQSNGWLQYQGTFTLYTLFYGEYANSGLYAVMDMRVKWKGFKVIIDFIRFQQISDPKNRLHFLSIDPYVEWFDKLSGDPVNKMNLEGCKKGLEPDR